MMGNFIFYITTFLLLLNFIFFIDDIKNSKKYFEYWTGGSLIANSILFGLLFSGCVFWGLVMFAHDNDSFFSKFLPLPPWHQYLSTEIFYIVICLILGFLYASVPIMFIKKILKKNANIEDVKLAIKDQKNKKYNIIIGICIFLNGNIRIDNLISLIDQFDNSKFSEYEKIEQIRLDNIFDKLIIGLSEEEKLNITKTKEGIISYKVKLQNEMKILEQDLRVLYSEKIESKIIKQLYRKYCL